MKFIILLLALTTLIYAEETKVSSDKPNILFIFSDDWGWGDLSCHGHPYVKTPNIDKLAAEGTDFHKFTVASGVCSPSRAAVITGHFPARYSIDGHFARVSSNAKRGMPDWLNPEAPLLTRMLQKAGYATAHYGKWHISNNMIPDSPLPSAYCYDEYGAFNCAGEQMPVHEDSERAIKFIEKSNAAGKPFFINLWIHEPHVPFHTVDEIRSRFPDLDEADNIYASVLSHADDRIGEVLDCLDKLKIADNTLVIFSSDNGPARGGANVEPKPTYDSATGHGYGIGAAKGITGGRRGYKGALFEGGIGVPFIARWPGKIAAGKVDGTSLISAVDLLPTFVEIAGAELPADYKPDGLSQVKTLKGEAFTKREKPLFWKIGAKARSEKSKSNHWVGYAVVDQQWKLVTTSKMDYVELYDIAADSYEKTDLKEANPDVVARMTKLLTDWQATLPTTPDPKCFSNKRK